MKKRLFKSLFFVFVLVFALGGIFSLMSVPATEKASAAYLDDSVEYESIDKTIDISDKKVLNITEVITVNYLKSGKVGIVRNISKVNRITRIVNGKKYTRVTKNKFILLSLTMDGGEEYHFVEEDEDYFFINTGADGAYKSKGSTHTYTINYTLDMGEDFIKSFDDFTFDLLDYGVASPVNSFSAKFTLPKAFIPSGKTLADILTFRRNLTSTTSFEDVNFSIDGNTISCSLGYSGELEGLTVQLILPNKYFDTKYTPNFMYYLIIVGILATIVTTIVVVLRYRRKIHSTQVVEFYPPEDYSPIDVARVYRGEISSRDFASLMIYWASKNYVTIEKTGKNAFLIKKLKDFPLPAENSEMYESKVCEKRYFDQLFKNGDEYVMSGSASKYVDASRNDAIKRIYAHNYPEKAKMARKFALPIQIVSALSIGLYVIWNYFIFFQKPIFIVMLVPVALIFFFLMSDTFIQASSDLLVLASRFVLPFAVFLLLIFDVVRTAYDICGLLYIAMAVFAISNIVASNFKGYTKKEIEMRGRILGFKQFLVSAELNKLERLIEENPNYYYDILPYCYVFRITKKLESKFKAMRVANPEYFNGESATNFYYGFWMSSRLSGTTAHYVKSKFGSGFSSKGGFGGGFGGSRGGGGGGGGLRSR